MFKVFYSWQSDLPNKTNRSFIDSRLQYACSKLKTTQGAIVDAVVDRDTLGKSGAPDIKEVILAKIADSDAFVGDISIVNFDANTSSKGRSTPNPNVLVETGYALSCLGPEALILVYNTHFGAMTSLPFDLRGMRILPYSLAPEEDKKAAGSMMQSAFENAINSVASTVRSDPIYSQLYLHSKGMVGQVEGMIRHLLELAPGTQLTSPLEITQPQLQAVCCAIKTNQPSPLISLLPQRHATVIECMLYWRSRSQESFKRLMIFSPALKPEHMVLAAAVEHSPFYSYLDQYSSIASGTLEYLSSMIFSQIQIAKKLEKYSEKYLARRAGAL